MTSRKHSPLHDKWHRIVEGQIRHTIGQHPEWFTFKSEMHKRTCVISIAKRIVGEIVADLKLATSAEPVVAAAGQGRDGADAGKVFSPERGDCAHVTHLSAIPLTQDNI